MPTAINKDEQIKKLETFRLSDDLENLSLLTNKFNIFNVLKLSNAEIRHSNFLAWLMNPLENHEIGNFFLKEFLKTATKDYISSEDILINEEDISSKDFFECEVRREYKNIDILLVDKDSCFVCVIENKIWSGEHSEQLFKWGCDVKILKPAKFKEYYKKYLQDVMDNL